MEVVFDVRPMQRDELHLVVDYFLQADKSFHLGMGVDTEKLPARDEWLDMLLKESEKKVEDKKTFFVIWLLNSRPVGHSNINKIIFGKEAFMHLHVWQQENRTKKFGSQFIKKSLPFYFDYFKLETLFCEPWAFNEAPNKTLERIGFDFIRRYETMPGWINSFQMVNPWALTSEKFKSL